MTIPKSENQYIEFKAESVKAISLAEEMVAFSNSEGGEIWLGVEDDGTASGAVHYDITGIERAKISDLDIGQIGQYFTRYHISFFDESTSVARNPVLMRVMENLGYVDKLGRGLPMVWQEAKKLGQKVQFVESGEEFRVILPLPPV